MQLKSVNKYAISVQNLILDFSIFKFDKLALYVYMHRLLETK